MLLSKTLRSLLVVTGLAVAPHAAAQALEPPSGPVVLTVTGAIAETNRPAYDDTQDAFFGYHEKSFERATAFDRAMLKALGMQKVTIDYPGLEAPMVMEGPWLSDVLAAVGSRGKTLAVMALDGFVSEIAAEELATHDWLLALKKDGQYLGLGQRGPLWLVYRRKDGQALTADDELRWPWAAFLIEIK